MTLACSGNSGTDLFSASESSTTSDDASASNTQSNTSSNDASATGTSDDSSSTGPILDVGGAGGTTGGDTGGDESCELAAGNPSNVGCVFWAVDLPNARGLDSAWSDEWGVVLANAAGQTAQVVIERNTSGPNEALMLEVVEMTDIPAGTLKAIELPQAEVTGYDPATTVEPPGPPGTFVSSNAFRITSTSPLVAYQFNNFTNNYSTDASLLLPESGLGDTYRIIGYPTANPISIFPIAGIPDYSSVTVVAIEDNTEVTVRPTHKTRSDMIGFPVLDPGEEHTITLGAFDVLNVASDGIPGDLSGTVVEASAPVVVFSSGERGIGPILNTGAPEPPGGIEDLCCTDHLEEQIFPVTSLGTTFVIPHSPYRGTTFIEPDELRFMGVAESSTVTTNLPAPWNIFTLAPGEIVDAYAQGPIVVEASEPVLIGQILSSQSATEDYIGDPSLTIFPAIEQYRDDYIFLMPPTWVHNYMVIMAPLGTEFALDGQALPSTCTKELAGTIDGTDFEVTTCELDEGVHNIASVALKGEGTPFGLAAYGYGAAGSYAYAGGADVEAIYDPPAIP